MNEAGRWDAARRGPLTTSTEADRRLRFQHEVNRSRARAQTPSRPHLSPAGRYCCARSASQPKTVVSLESFVFLGPSKLGYLVLSFLWTTCCYLLSIFPLAFFSANLILSEIVSAFASLYSFTDLRWQISTPSLPSEQRPLIFHVFSSPSPTCLLVP